MLEEAVADWFEEDDAVPFMMQVFQIREEKRGLIPAVTHVDGSGRLQTVSRHTNPRYHRLIEAFRDLTGVPMVLNTSFNENEPVVCEPKEALDCFLRTKMDVLVMGETILIRQNMRSEAVTPEVDFHPGDHRGTVELDPIQCRRSTPYSCKRSKGMLRLLGNRKHLYISISEKQLMEGLRMSWCGGEKSANPTSLHAVEAWLEQCIRSGSRDPNRITKIRSYSWAMTFPRIAREPLSLGLTYDSRVRAFLFDWRCGLVRQPQPDPR